MTPTPEEKLWLRDYLYKTMQYRETFEEVYDHILQALENQPDFLFFKGAKGAVLKIITDDFGDTEGLRLLEDNCKLQLKASVQKKYLDSLKRWFGSFLIILTVSMFAVLLRLQYTEGNGGVFFLLFITLLILPIILLSIMKFRIGYKYGRTKPSIKEAVFRKIVFRINRIIWRTLICIKLSDLITRDIFKIQHWPADQTVTLNVIYVLFTMLLVSMIIHNLVMIRLIRSEFKTAVAQ